jgi:branched-chain amino acid transport system ATP-binding protein
MMLEVENVESFYGSSQILFGVTLKVGNKQAVCLLGRNGAGKTTTFRSITGLVQPKSGSVRYRGEEISKKSCYSIARLGIGLVPEDRRIFPRLTLVENLEVARKSSHTDDTWTLDRVFDLFPTLRNRKNNLGRQLSGGEQQMLAIGRTLMGNPDLLLVDEPMEGLAPLVVRDLSNVLKTLKEQGLTILVCEQNTRAAMKMSDYCYILNKGVICFQGTSDEISKREDVLATYLGVQVGAYAQMEKKA